MNLLKEFFIRIVRNYRYLAWVFRQ